MAGWMCIWGCTILLCMHVVSVLFAGPGYHEARSAGAFMPGFVPAHGGLNPGVSYGNLSRSQSNDSQFQTPQQKSTLLYTPKSAPKTVDSSVAEGNDVATPFPDNQLGLDSQSSFGTQSSFPNTQHVDGGSTGGSLEPANKAVPGPVNQAPEVLLSDESKKQQCTQNSRQGPSMLALGSPGPAETPTVPAVSKEQAQTSATPSQVPPESPTVPEQEQATALANDTPSQVLPESPTVPEQEQATTPATEATHEETTASTPGQQQPLDKDKQPLMPTHHPGDMYKDGTYWRT